VADADFHTQTAGVSLPAASSDEQTIAPLRCRHWRRAGGTQSLHTDSYDEDCSANGKSRRGLRAHAADHRVYESGVTQTVDPLADRTF